MRGQIEEMEAIFEEFPDLKQTVRSMKRADNDSGMLAGVDLGGDMVFNGRFFGRGNLDELKETHAQNVASGFFPQGTNWRHVGVHEPF